MTKPVSKGRTERCAVRPIGYAQSYTATALLAKGELFLFLFFFIFFFIPSLVARVVVN